MKLYGGIDLHSNNCVVVLVDEDSREVLRKRIDNDISKMIALLDPEPSAKLIDEVLKLQTIPEQSFRSCLGILRMGKLYGTDRLENAAIRALHIGAYRYKSIESILKNGLDQQPLPLPASETTAAVTATLYDNVRGAEYFH